MFAPDRTNVMVSPEIPAATPKVSAESREPLRQVIRRLGVPQVAF